MTRSLLVRGMLVGLLAGLLAFAFARWAGESEVERAIALETSMDQAKGISPEPELVSRKVQKSLGLLTGLAVYGTAIGGLFGLVFAFAYGRVGTYSPRTLSAVLAAMGFIAIVVVPTIKYPANPPSVGNPETIGARTAAFFLLMVFFVAAMVLALQVRQRFAIRLGDWNSWLMAVALFLFMVIIVFHFLPVFDEIPAGFPVSLMWRFRIAALGIQAVLWATLGLLFGWLPNGTGNGSKLGRWGLEGAGLFQTCPGPSTTLRFGRDDNSSEISVPSLRIQTISLQQNCHPDRSVA